MSFQLAILTTDGVTGYAEVAEVNASKDALKFNCAQRK